MVEEREAVQSGARVAPRDVGPGGALGGAVTLGLAAGSAHRGLVFARRGGRIVLQDDGAVWPALRGLLRRGGRPA